MGLENSIEGNIPQQTEKERRIGQKKDKNQSAIQKEIEVGSKDGGDKKDESEAGNYESSDNEVQQFFADKANGKFKFVKVIPDTDGEYYDKSTPKYLFVDFKGIAKTIITEDDYGINYTLGAGFTVDSEEDFETLAEILASGEEDGGQLNEMYEEYKRDLAMSNLKKEDYDDNFFRNASVDEVVNRLNELYIRVSSDGEEKHKILKVIKSRFGEIERRYDFSANDGPVTEALYCGRNVPQTEEFVLKYVNNQWKKYPREKFDVLVASGSSDFERSMKKKYGDEADLIIPLFPEG